MNISRLAKETSRLTAPAPPFSRSTRLQTRSFAQTLSTFVANGVPVTKTEEEEHEIKEEVESGDESSQLSSAASTFSIDIENLPVSFGGARKRKRGADSVSITALSTATTSSHRTQLKVNAVSSVQDDNNPRTARKQSARKIPQKNGEVEIHPPPHWEKIYDAVTEMRKKILAPVDTMGCEILAEEHASPRVRSRITAYQPHSASLTACRLHRTSVSRPSSP